MNRRKEEIAAALHGELGRDKRPWSVVSVDRRCAEYVEHFRKLAELKLHWEVRDTAVREVVNLPNIGKS